MTLKRTAFLALVVIGMLCIGMQTCATTNVQGYVVDPNWYSKHPQMSSLFGTGLYEYGVGGNLPGSGLQVGLCDDTDIFGKFYQGNMPDGTYVLAAWDTWWRQELKLGCNFNGLFAPPTVIQLHANMWSYAPTWDLAHHAEHGQLFKASGTSVVFMTLPAAGDTRQYTITFHQGGRGGPQVGPTTTVSGSGDIRIKWSGGRIPTVPGQLYYVKIAAAGANIRNNEPIPDYSDPMPEGCLYQDGVADVNRDLGLTICSDDDGILTNMYVPESGAIYGNFSSIGQTFTARGVNLLSFAAWILDNNYAYVAQLYTGVNGTKIGPAKSAMVMRRGSGDPEIIWTWAPNECPLTPGNTYYIEIKRADGGNFGNYISSRWNEYYGGEAYVDRQPAVTGSNPWDLSGTIMEEESSGSATIAPVKFVVYPNVSRADRGATSLTVRWNTDAASDSTVEYAAWNCPYTDTYYNSTLTTFHSAVLTGLKPNTLYHIRVKSAASGRKTGVSRDFVCCTNAISNMLVNGDFENGSGASPQKTIPGWTMAPGNMDYGVSDGTWFAGGEMIPYSGNWFLEFASNHGGTAESKVYQTVNVTPGKEYTLTAAVSDFMQENNTYKYDVWYQEGRLPYIRLGVDPYGNNDPLFSTINWTPKMYSHLHYTVFGTKFTAQSNKVTVFAQVGGKGGQWQLFGIDNVQVSPVYNFQPFELKNLKSLSNGTEAQVSDLIITAIPSEAGAYYAQTQDRSQGIRIESTETVAVGKKVTVVGTLQTKPTGERYLANAAFSNAVTSTEPKPVMMLSSAVGGAAFGTIPAVPGSKGPHNTALAVKIAGTVTAKAADSSYIMISDGSLNSGIKVDTSRISSASVPGVGDVVSVSGISSIYSDGSIKPMIIARRASDISSDLNP